MALTKRQGTKTITMPPVPENPAPAPAPVTRRGTAADSASRWIGKRKPRMQPGKLRKKRDWRSRKSIRSFRSRCMTA